MDFISKRKEKKYLIIIYLYHKSNLVFRNNNRDKIYRDIDNRDQISYL